MIAATKTLNRIAQFAFAHPNLVLHGWFAMAALIIGLAVMGPYH